MATPREPWHIRPSKKPVSVAATMKAEIETRAKDFIEKVLKPKCILPKKDDEQFNYITDIGVKWYRNNFYVFLIYACPSPTALSPTFETMFARMEPLGGGRFALYAMRYTGKEWVGVLDTLSLDECLMAIRDNEWFEL